MADRYQRPFPGEDSDRGARRPEGESDPLAELARLIGQTDPLSSFGRANQPMPAHEVASSRHSEPEPEIEEAPPAGPPRWMQRAREEAAPQQDFTPVHPLRRYAAARPEAEPDYHEAPPFAAEAEQPDPSRDDHALYGEPDPGTYDPQHQDAGYAEDAYAYQDGYAEEAEPKSRRGGMITVAAVLALAGGGTRGG